MATIAMIVGALAAAGSAAYSASQASDAAGNAGGIPKAAEYQSVDFGKQQLDTVMDDYNNLGWIRGLNGMTNAVISTQDMKRANKFIPNYKQFLQQESANTGSLLRGQLPYDDVLDIARHGNELSGAMGTPGVGMPGTLRDLGLSRLNAMQAGQGMLQGMVSMAEQVSPVGRYSRPQDYYLYPSQTVPWEIEQKQLEQQSLQNKYNLSAGISPTQLAQNAAALSGASNPYSSIGPALSSIGGALNSPTAFGGSSPASTGGYASALGATTAAPYAASISYDPTMGYTPVPYAIAA